MAFQDDHRGVFVPTNNLTNDMTDLLNQHLKGKEFLYRSKYGGETFGEIESCFVCNSVTWDQDTSKNFKANLDWVKTHNRKDKIKPEPIPVTNPYSAYRPQIRIMSTTGIGYTIDEIFILNDK